MGLTTEINWIEFQLDPRPCPNVTMSQLNNYTYVVSAYESCFRMDVYGGSWGHRGFQTLQI